MNSQHDEVDSDDEIDPFKSIMLPPQLRGAEAAVLQDPSLENQSNSIQEVEQNNFYLSAINSNLVTRQLPSQGLSFQLWPASITLINLLDNHLCHPSISSSKPLYRLFKSPDNDRPLRILELGSGTGLVGIAAAVLLGANVTVTDLPHVLPNLHFNVEANSKILQLSGGEAKVTALSWGEAEHMEAIGKDYDLILGSDVVYHDHLYAPLIETLKFFLLENGEKRVVFVMAHLKRWKKESAFFKKAKKFFDIQVIHTDPPFQGSRVGVVLYKFAGSGGFPSVKSVLGRS